MKNFLTGFIQTLMKRMGFIQFRSSINGKSSTLKSASSSIGSTVGSPMWDIKTRSFRRLQYLWSKLGGSGKKK